MKLLLTAGAAALVLSGCGYTELHEVVLRQPSGPTGHTVEVYLGAQRPPRPFYEVALLQAIAHGSDANLGDLVKALTARAGVLGCDAIVRVQIDQGYSIAHGFAVCAKYAAAAPQARPPLMPRQPPPAPGPAPEPAPSPGLEPAPAPGDANL